MDAAIRFFSENESNFSNPQIITEVVGTLQDHACSADHLAVILEKEPDISSKILRLANSALFGVPKTITSLKAACVRLGNSNIARLALVAGASGKHSDPVKLKRFWNHCFATASLSKHISQYLKHTSREQDEFLTLGLLHDLGLLLELGAGVVDQIQEKMQSEKVELRTAEKKVLGFDHLQLGAVASRNWNFPEDLKAVIEFHHEPEKAGDFEEQAIVVYLANMICRSQKLTCVRHMILPGDIRESYLQKVGIPVEQLILFSDWLGQKNLPG